MDLKKWKGKKMKPLSQAMVKGLLRFQPGRWKCRYKLRIGEKTVLALVNRGLVKSRGQDKPGAFSMPETVIEYSLTEKGEQERGFYEI